MNKQINLFWIALVLSAIIFTSCPPPPEAVAVTGVSLSQSRLALAIDESVALTATVSPENATNKNISWSSSDETVATVDTNGLVKAQKAGTATITVKTEDGEKTAACSVAVKPVISVTGVKLNYTQIYGDHGESFILTATVEPSNASNKTVTWTTSNGSIATVDNGIVTMTGSTVWKNATITCTTADGSKTATCTVTVIQKPTASVADANGFVTISAGSMPLNSDGSYHVTLTKAYMICDHEVTQKEWQDVMGNNPSYFSSNPASGEEQENRPVECVSWYDAITYCNKLSIKDGLQPCYSVKVGETEVDWANLKYDDIPTYGKDAWNATFCDFSKNGYRLPTEAEWEYAARGGETANDKPVWAGTTIKSELTNYAWYPENGSSKTHEVKKKLPNGYGLYDMSGNVDELCWDWYGDYASEDAIDPTGAESGSSRVLRGGSWNYHASKCRASFRDYYLPAMRNGSVGFRLVRTVQQ